MQSRCAQARASLEVARACICRIRLMSDRAALSSLVQQGQVLQQFYALLSDVVTHAATHAHHTHTHSLTTRITIIAIRAHG